TLFPYTTLFRAPRLGKAFPVPYASLFQGPLTHSIKGLAEPAILAGVVWNVLGWSGVEHNLSAHSQRTGCGWRPVEEYMGVTAWIHVGLGALKVGLPETPHVFCHFGRLG